MRLLPLFGFVAGAILAAKLLSVYGLARILHLVAGAGWWLVPAVLFHLVQVLASALGWRAALGDPRGPGRARFMLLRLMREAVNNLLPVAQIGGEVMSVRWLRRLGVALPEAIAGTVGDLTLEVVTQIAFTVLALLLLVALRGVVGVAHTVALGLIGAVALAGGLIAVQLLGVSTLIERVLRKLGGAGLRGLQHDLFGPGSAGGNPQTGARVQPALNALYRSPRRLGRGAFWHALSWALGGVEVSLMLHALGHDTAIGPGLVIEMLGQALKSAGFAVPGALGVQEGGLIVVCGLFNLAPELAIALSLVKRLREVSYGLPSLLLWQRFDSAPSKGDAPAAEALTAPPAP